MSERDNFRAASSRRARTAGHFNRYHSLGHQGWQRPVGGAGAERLLALAIGDLRARVRPRLRPRDRPRRRRSRQRVLPPVPDRRPPRQPPDPGAGATDRPSARRAPTTAACRPKATAATLASASSNARRSNASGSCRARSRRRSTPRASLGLAGLVAYMGGISFWPVAGMVTVMYYTAMTIAFGVARHDRAGGAAALAAGATRTEPAPA